MKIWAHRGCSARYPQNTLTAFRRAASLDGLTGIELDIRFTKDRHIVVSHDSVLESTTDGRGKICDYTLEQIQGFNIYNGGREPEHIPTIDEVFDLLCDSFKRGLLLNIEIKETGDIVNDIVEKVNKRNIGENVIYSSFCAATLAAVKAADENAHTAILSDYASNGFYMKMGGCGADDIHPNWHMMDVPPEKLKGHNVRAWAGGAMFPQNRGGGV